MSTYAPGTYQALKDEVKEADCSRRRVGAVLVKDGQIVGRGHNGLVWGSCLDGQCPRGRMSYDDQPKDVGYAESGCTAVHAEAMAVYQAADLASGATLWVTEVPCPGCQSLLITFEVRDVRLVDFRHPVFTNKFIPPV